MADPELRMMMQLILILMATTFLALGATPSPGADGAAKHDPRAAFAESDLNHDGVVDHEEFQLRITEVFYSVDRNKDGFLDPQELQQLAFPDDFTATDKDHNGRLSLREFLRVRFRDYQVADKDDDGVLSLDEVIAVFEVRKRQ